MLFIKRTIVREDSIGIAEWEYAGEWMRELGSPLPRVFAATKWREAGERLQQHLDELLEHWDRCLATEFTPWQLKIFTLETLLACQISEKEAFSNPKRVWIISNSLSLKLGITRIPGDTHWPDECRDFCVTPFSPRTFDTRFGDSWLCNEVVLVCCCFFVCLVVVVFCVGFFVWYACVFVSPRPLNTGCYK